MSRTAAAAAAVAAAVSFCFLVLTVILLLHCKKKRAAKSESCTAASLPAHSLPFSDVDAATAGFNQSLIIGMGHLGAVYTAASSSGGGLAVKRVAPHLVLANPGVGFASRAKTLSLIHHPNIVPVLGYSEAPGERIIITELVAGARSLESLQRECSPAFLEWGVRVRIAAGAARGLERLHEGGVVHGRLKPSNVLVDGGFTAQLSDYGLGFLASGYKRGMAGYSDGERWSEPGATCKASDVYAFGVIVLELMSGRRSEEGRLVDWALPLIRGSRLEVLLDPNLKKPIDMRPLIRMAKVASACVGNCRINRPAIDQVAGILNSLELQTFD